MALLARANDTFGMNSLAGVDQALSANGSDWLWAVTGLLIASFFGLLVFCFTSRESDRVLHYLFTITLLIGSTTYFAQAADLGWTAVDQADHTANGSRQVFYARYIYWAVSFPATALGLGLISGVSWTTIITNLTIAWFWVLTYLAGAFTTTDYKWGFFAFGTFGWLILAMSTLNESREAAQRTNITRDYMLLSAWANMLWLLYPIAWALSDGGNVIGVTGASVFFGVLDVLMVPPLGFAILFLGRNWDYGNLRLDISEHRFFLPTGKSSTVTVME